MKKYIIALIGCTLLLGCKQEVLEPEQMIQGMFAFDNGIGLTDRYLKFDNGYLTVYTLKKSCPFAENKIWQMDTDPASVQYVYTINEGNIYTSKGPNGKIELKDGVLTLDGITYSTLEGFEKDPYSSIIVDKEVIVPFVAQDNSIPCSVEKPIPAGELTAATTAAWIQKLEVKGGAICFFAPATTEERSAIIELNYTCANRVFVTVKQAPFTFIRLQENSRTVNYAASTQTLDYTIENPVEGSELSVSTTADWIRNISVQSNKVIFDVPENNTGSSRTTTLRFTYTGAEDVIFTLTQNWVASSIVLNPSSEQYDYTGGTGSFTFKIENPREGISCTTTNQSDWITDVVLSGNIVSYKVAENNSGRARTGQIKMSYGNYATKAFSINQTWSAPTIIVTPSAAQFDYVGGSGSFTFEIQNPREGVFCTAESQADWITDVVLSGNTVSYKIAENNSWSQRTGMIRLNYGMMAAEDCCITQIGKPLSEAVVDLGLSVNWSSCNLGANCLVDSPEEYGAYYAWGETGTKSYYSWTNYKYRTSGDSSNNVKFSKYNTQSSKGIVDNKTVLELSDDVAHQKLGSSFRLPTEEEYQELFDNCNVILIEQNGVYGCLFTSKKTNYTSNSIFFPAAGEKGDSGALWYDNFTGYYWSSSLSIGPAYARTLDIGRDNARISGMSRCTGISIRPVFEK